MLPDYIPRKDVVFNLQRVALLLHSLQSGDFALLKQATPLIACINLSGRPWCRDWSKPSTSTIRISWVHV